MYQAPQRIPNRRQKIFRYIRTAGWLCLKEFMLGFIGIVVLSLGMLAGIELLSTIGGLLVFFVGGGFACYKFLKRSEIFFLIMHILWQVKSSDDPRPLMDQVAEEIENW